jgi:hypothetical protein
MSLPSQIDGPGQHVFFREDKCRRNAETPVQGLFQSLCYFSTELKYV